MDTLLHLLRQHGVLSADQYWHLRLLSAITFGPLLAVLYLVVRYWRKPRTPRVPASPPPTLWIGEDGRLLIRHVRPQTPA